MFLFQISGKDNSIHPACIRYLTLIQSDEEKKEKEGEKQVWVALYKHAEFP